MSEREQDGAGGQRFRATTRDGRRLVCRRVGHGPLVVGHPGGPGFAGSALRDLGGLDEHFTLLLVDPRGTGDSDAARHGRYDLDGYVDDLEDLLEVVDEPVHALVGHSHGGLVSLAYAARNPGSVDRLVLMNTPSHLDDARIEVLDGSDHVIEMGSVPEPADGARRPTTGSAAAAERRRLLRLGPGPPPTPVLVGARSEAWGAAGTVFTPALGEELVTFAPLAWFNAHEIDRFDLRPVLAEVDVDTVVLCGRDDAVAPPDHSWEMASRLPRAALVIIEGAGHVPYIENRPAFRDAMLAHLAP